MITPQQFIDAARELVGTRFRHQGRSRHGVDCAGLLALSLTNAGLCVAKDLGIRDRLNYGRLPGPELYEAVQRHCRRVPPHLDLVPGSVALIQWPKHRAPSHFAVVTECRTIIQAYDPHGAVETSYSGSFLRNTHSVWLMPGIDYGVS